MAARAVRVSVGGQSYRITSSASEDELQHLADVVRAKLAALSPKGRPAPEQAMLLVAMALAHDIEAERRRRESLEQRVRDFLRRVLHRVDGALEELDGPEGRGR